MYRAQRSPPSSDSSRKPYGPRCSLAKAVTGVSPSSTTSRVTGTMRRRGGPARRRRRRSRSLAARPRRSCPAAGSGDLRGCRTRAAWRGAAPSWPSGWRLPDRQRPLVERRRCRRPRGPGPARRSSAAYLNTSVGARAEGQRWWQVERRRPRAAAAPRPAPAPAVGGEGARAGTHSSAKTTFSGGPVPQDDRAGLARGEGHRGIGRRRARGLQHDRRRPGE